MTSSDCSRSQFTLVKLTNEDIPSIVDLSKIIGWDYTPSDLKTILASGIVFGHKSKNRQLVSTAAIFPYDNKFTSIGMVIVHPKYRGMQLGKMATQACLEQFKGKPAMLIATTEGIPLYERMGFIKVDSLYKLIAEKYTGMYSAGQGEFKSRPYQETDFHEVIQIDERAFGANRKGFIKARIEQSKESIVLTNSKSKVVGFGLSIELPDMLLIGPIVAPDTYHAAFLIHALIHNDEGRIRIDVPSNKLGLVNQLKQCGFDIVNQPPVMVVNANELPKRNNSLYGIAAQAFG